MIFISGLNAVVAVAKALPVALIPEENLVSSVRNDMIHISCLDVASLLHALHAQRMGFKITLAGFVPSAAIASASCGACFLRMEGAMFVAVFCTIGYECCTAGMFAGCIWSAWHWDHLRFLYSKKPLLYTISEGYFSSV